MKDLCSRDFFLATSTIDGDIMSFLSSKCQDKEIQDYSPPNSTQVGSSDNNSLCSFDIFGAPFFGNRALVVKVVDVVIHI